MYAKQNISLQEIDNYLNEVLVNKLNDTDADICEGSILEEECNTIISKMSKNKSPGIDGLPNEFYLLFWNDIKTMVIDSFNEAFEQGELSETHKQIILSLIFKKGNRKLLKN